MKIISKVIELPCGAKVKKYLNKTIGEISETIPDTKTSKPTFTITKKESPKSTIKPSITSSDITAQQNRATLVNEKRAGGMIINKKTVGTSISLANDYNRLTTGINGSISLENANMLCRLFAEDTGLKLHCPTPRTNLFGLALGAISRDVKAGTFPKDIKHVIIGHGLGSSANNTWSFEGLSFADKKIVNVFEYINKNIPRGEKVLVCSCEEGGTAILGKGCIGRHVELSLAVPTEPAKIVQAGKNEIIGHYTSYDSQIPASGVKYY